MALLMASAMWPGGPTEAGSKPSGEGGLQRKLQHLASLPGGRDALGCPLFPAASGLLVPPE